jgi:hypothetical protein
MANTLPGSPIMGFYKEEKADFDEHNKLIRITGGTFEISDETRPYGFVDLNAKVWFQDYLDDSEKIHTYMVTEGYIWTGRYPEANRILTHGNGQSMELDEDSMQGHWTIDDKSGMEFFIINDAIFRGLCILGEDTEPCFEGAQITGSFSLDESFDSKIYKLMKEVQQLKGGNFTVEDDKMKKPEEEVIETQVEEPVAEPEEDPTESAPADPEEPTIEEPAAEDPEVQEEEPAAEEPAEGEVEPSEDENSENNEGEGVQFSLEDFQNLQESYSNLETQFNELQRKFDDMSASYDVLVEFKNAKDREEKQAMIDSFYMLSDSDKEDVQNNIDNYSLDEIEAKLSVICVHNKLDLSGGTNDNNNPETTFSLDDVDDDNSEDANIPALVSALRKNRKSEK